MATKHLQAAANRQKVLHDHNVKDVLIPEGKLVYLRDVGLRGRNKIYVWSSVVYGVLRAPRDGGSVYTIAPVDDPSKARNVHCSPLKDHPGHADAAETPVDRPSEDVESPVEEVDSLDGDLYVVGPESIMTQAPVDLCPRQTLHPRFECELLLQPPPL